jgi:hypothetical protein
MAGPGGAAAGAGMGGHGGGGAGALGLGGIPGISSATAGIPAPSFMGEFGQALAQFPEQQRKAQMEKVELDQAKADADKTKVDNATAQMGLLARMARGNPNWQDDPRIEARLEQLSKDANFPLPRDANGRADLNAIPGSGGVTDMTYQERQAAMALPETQRRVAFPGQDEQFYKAPMYVAPKDAAVLQREFTQLLGGVGKPGGYQALKGWIAGNGPAIDQLEAAGLFSRADLVSYLDDPSVQAAMTAQADAKLSQLSALGLSETALANVRNTMLPLQEQNLKSLLTDRNISTQVKVAGVGQRDRQLDIMQQNANSNAAKASAAATTADAAASKAAETWAALQSKPDPVKQAQLKLQLGVAQSQANAAAKEYDALKSTANTILNGIGKAAGAMTSTQDKSGKIQSYLSALGDPSDPSTVAGQMAAAKGKLDHAQATLQQVSDGAKNLAGTTLTNASGHPTTVRDANPSANAQSYTDPQGGKWKQLPNGKWQRIQ